MSVVPRYGTGLSDLHPMGASPDRMETFHQRHRFYCTTFISIAMPRPDALPGRVHNFESPASPRWGRRSDPAGCGEMRSGVRLRRLKFCGHHLLKFGPTLSVRLNREFYISPVLLRAGGQSPPQDLKEFFGHRGFQRPSESVLLLSAFETFVCLTNVSGPTHAHIQLYPMGWVNPDQSPEGFFRCQLATGDAAAEIGWHEIGKTSRRDDNG